MRKAFSSVVVIVVAAIGVWAVLRWTGHSSEADDLRANEVKEAEDRARIAEAQAREAHAEADQRAQEAAQRQPVNMLDEQWVLETDGWKYYSFTLPDPMLVRVDMEPVQDADKGVTLRLVPAEDADACSGRTRGACRSLGAFDGLGVRTFSHADTIADGRWSLIVGNTENIMNAATVHVRLSATRP